MSPPDRPGFYWYREDNKPGNRGRSELRVVKLTLRSGAQFVGELCEDDDVAPFDTRDYPGEDRT